MNDVATLSACPTMQPARAGAASQQTAETTTIEGAFSATLALLFALALVAPQDTAPRTDQSEPTAEPVADGQLALLALSGDATFGSISWAAIDGAPVEHPGGVSPSAGAVKGYLAGKALSTMAGIAASLTEATQQDAPVSLNPSELSKPGIDISALGLSLIVPPTLPVTATDAKASPIVLTAAVSRLAEGAPETLVSKIEAIAVSLNLPSANSSYGAPAATMVKSLRQSKEGDPVRSEPVDQVAEFAGRTAPIILPPSVSQPIADSNSLPELTSDEAANAVANPTPMDAPIGKPEAPAVPGLRPLPMHAFSGRVDLAVGVARSEVALPVSSPASMPISGIPSSEGGAVALSTRVVVSNPVVARPAASSTASTVPAAAGEGKSTESLTGTAEPTPASSNSSSPDFGERRSAEVRLDPPGLAAKEKETVLVRDNSSSISTASAGVSATAPPVRPSHTGQSGEVPAVPLPDIPKAPTTGTVRDMSIRLGDSQSGMIDLKIRERAGELGFSVRTDDMGIATTLRRDLKSLVDGLDRLGLPAVTWTPAQKVTPAASLPADPKDDWTSSNHRGQGHHQQQSKRDENERQEPGTADDAFVAERLKFEIETP